MAHIPEGPAYPRSLPAQLKMLNDVKNDMFGYFEYFFAEYGDVVAFKMPKGVYYAVANPDFTHEMLVNQPEKFHKDNSYKHPKTGLARFMGNGLVTSDGEFWKRQRKLVAPAFHVKRIEAYAATMVEYTDRMLKHWRDGSQIELDHEMMHLTLQIVGKTLMNMDISQSADRIGKAMDVLQAIMTPIDVLPAWLPTPGRIRMSFAIRDLDAIVYGMIAEWKKTREDRGDLLSMLMLAEDDNGAPMSDQQVRDEAVTLLLAGHETTAHTLNWTFSLLAQNPDAEAKLHAELDTVLHGELPTLADLKRLPYTDIVIKESMRLLPAVYSIGRQSIADTEIMGYTIPKYTDVTVFSYFMHRNPRLWDQADQFMPERFSPDNEKNLPRYAYLPFGGGPRICVGNSFAAMEARLLLATIAQKYQLRLNPGHKIELEPLITLRPKGGLTMRIEQREPIRELA